MATVVEVVEATAVEVIHEFDYSELDIERRVIVQQRSSEIKSLLRQRAQNAIEIGQKLAEVKDSLGYGLYCRWLETEFAWGRTLAHQFENAAKQFADVHNVNNFDSSALRLLASPSVPEEARDEAKSLVEAGDRVTHADAQAIVAKHKPQSEKAAKPQPPDPFPVGRTVTVASGEYQGQQVTVVESDGVTVQCRTDAGEVVPLLTAELESPNLPESPQPAAPPKSAAPSPIELLSIDLDVAKSRVEFLESKLRRIEDFLANVIQYLPSRKLKQSARDLLKPQPKAATVVDD